MNKKRKSIVPINLLVNDIEELIWLKQSQYVEDLFVDISNVQQHYSYQTIVRSFRPKRHPMYDLHYTEPSSRPSLDKFFQIASGCYAQHKPSSIIRDDCKL